MHNESEKGDIKGKGKDPHAGPASTPDASASDGPTARETLSQMARSATSFLLSGLPDAGLAGPSEKGESSRAGEALARAAESSVQLRPNIPSGRTSIRTGHTEEHIAQEEASFAAFLDSNDAPMLSGPSDLTAVLQPSVPDLPMTGRVASRDPMPLSVAEQEAKDGADVVALLSRDGDLDQVFNQTHKPASMENVELLRRALFGNGMDLDASGFAWDNILNFIPDYLQGPHGVMSASRSNDLALHLGTADPEAAWNAWISQWSRVLTSYQDEVWGDLGELVAEARAEVEQVRAVKPGEKPPQPTALLRLRAILGHLRGSS